MRKEAWDIMPDYCGGLFGLIRDLKDFFLEGKESSLFQVGKPVYLMLFDGMGEHLLKRLPKESFLRRHQIRVMRTVFPSTTTAATTTIMSGLSPREHGWLGWDLYFPDIDAQAVTVFLNQRMEDGRVAADFKVAERYLAYRDLFSQIEAKGHRVKVYSPFRGEPFTGEEDLFRKIKVAHERRAYDFIYSYWTQPDYLCHHVGAKSREVLDYLTQLDALAEKYLASLQDATLLITADHGLIDAEAIYLSDHPQLTAMFQRLPSVEARAQSFFLKQGKREPFVHYMKRHFPDFELYSKEELLEGALLGPGENHPRVKDFLGDFLAVARGRRYFVDSRAVDKGFLAVHAGLTPEELEVPLIHVGSSIEKRSV